MADVTKPTLAGQPGDEDENVPSAFVQSVPLTDDAVPIGPSADEEAAFISEDRIANPLAGPVPEINGSVPESELSMTPLPPMEDLVKRIPAPVRAMVDELFRAHFVTVKRMPTKALKS